jgi:hypothetical protein
VRLQALSRTGAGGRLPWGFYGVLGLRRVYGALQHCVEALGHVRRSTGGATVGLVGEGHGVFVCGAVCAADARMV